MTKIPLVDLGAQHAALKAELDEALARCAAASSFIGGPDHAAFAQEFADFCGGGQAALCGNGTDALELALCECLGPGDGTGEVLTVANTFIATVEAILGAGYRPVFVDVDPATGLMDPDALEAAATPRARAIVPVHLYGQMPDMERIAAFAAARGLAVVEDAAQAHGAAWRGKGPGLWGQAASFSFFPGKNLGAWGDAGAVFSRDEDLVRRIRRHADHGRQSKYLHDSPGRNSRLDGLQAAILRVKLRHLEAWNAMRRDIAAAYRALLAGIPGVEPPVEHPEARHVYHLFVVQVPRRDVVLEALHARGVMAGVHYPVPLHRQPVYQGRDFARVSLPHTERLAGRILSLPVFPYMTAEQTARVAESLAQALSETGA